MLLLSPEGTVLLSPVRKHDLGPCRITGNHVGLFTHLAGALRKRKVGRTSEEPLRGQGVCVSDGPQHGGGTGEGCGTTWLWRLGKSPYAPGFSLPSRKTKGLGTLVPAQSSHMN